MVNVQGNNADFQDRRRSGRPHKMSVPIQKKAVRMSRGRRNRSSRQVARLLKDRGTIDVSYRTLARHLKKTGLKPFRRRKKPRLTEKHATQRRRWARANTKTDWDRVIFTDEKIFRKFRPPNSKVDVVWAFSPSEVPPVQTESVPCVGRDLLEG
jgi:hypothetical protein